MVTVTVRFLRQSPARHFWQPKFHHERRMAAFSALKMALAQSQQARGLAALAFA
jgi:hypothetical protein